MSRRNLPSVRSKRGSKSISYDLNGLGQEKKKAKKRRTTGKISSRSKLKNAKSARWFRSLRLVKFLLLFGSGILLLSFLMLGIFLFNKRIWDGKERLTFVLEILKNKSSESEVFVVSYLPTDQELSVITFPDGMKIETVGEFGLWRIETIYSLGEIEGTGGIFLQRSLSELLATEVEGWLITNDDIEVSQEKFRSGLLKILARSIVSESETNFGYWDLAMMYGSISSVPGHRINWVELDLTDVLFREIQPDGSVEYFSDLELLDILSASLFYHPEIVEEGGSVVVLNATAHGKLGGRASRLVKNMGTSVIAVRDSSQASKVSSLVVSREDLVDSFTAQKLSKLFRINEIQVGDTSEHRAEMILVIGEDYWESLTEIES